MERGLIKSWRGEGMVHGTRNQCCKQKGMLIKYP